MREMRTTPPRRRFARTGAGNSASAGARIGPRLHAAQFGGAPFVRERALPPVRRAGNRRRDRRPVAGRPRPAPASIASSAARDGSPSNAVATMAATRSSSTRSKISLPLPSGRIPASHCELARECPRSPAVVVVRRSPSSVPPSVVSPSRPCWFVVFAILPAAYLPARPCRAAHRRPASRRPRGNRGGVIGQQQNPGRFVGPRESGASPRGRPSSASEHPCTRRRAAGASPPRSPARRRRPPRQSRPLEGCRGTTAAGPETRASHRPAGPAAFGSVSMPAASAPAGPRP